MKLLRGKKKDEKEENESDAQDIESKSQVQATTVTDQVEAAKNTAQQATKDKPQFAPEQKQQVATSPSTPQTTVQLEQTAVSEDEINKIIQAISQTNEGAVNPSINFEENRFYYPTLAHLGTHEYVTSILERLCSSSVGLLEKTVYEKIPVCPDHSGYFSSTLRLYCSSCLATDIVKLHLIEHKVCGHITEIRDYGMASELNTCISCKHQIKDPQKEIRRLGRWYECNKCKVKFDNCVVKLHCRKFDHDFDINQAGMIQIPSYRLRAEKSSQAYSLSLIPQIEKKLQSMGCSLEDASSVKGKSGMAHKASIYARADSKTIFIDIKSAEKTVDDTEIHSMIVRVLDIGPTLAIFVGMPAVSEAAKTMATANKISVITGNNLSEILSTVEQKIKTHIDSYEDVNKS